MSIFVPRSGKTFPEGTSNRAIVNHVRYMYSSMEEAYCDIFEIEKPPTCEHCSRNAVFRSFKDGYRNICGDRSCVLKNVKRTNRGIADRKMEMRRNEYAYSIFVRDNFELFRERVIASVPYYDEFLGLEVKTPGKHLGNRTNSSLLRLPFECVVSGDVYEVDLLRYKRDTDFLIGTKQGIRKLRLLPIEEIWKYIEFKERRKELGESDLESLFKLVKSCDLDKGFMIYVFKDSASRNLYTRYINGEAVFIDGVGVYPVSPKPSHTSLQTRLEVFFSDEYLMSKYPECLSECKNCEKTFKQKYVIYNFDECAVEYQVARSEHVCSRECYNALLATRKPELFYNITDADKERQSKTMKRLIAEGKFTPCVTNSRCKSRVDTRDGTKHFRSTWEAAFYSIMANEGYDLQFEKVRVKYQNPIKLTYHNYLVDFVDEVNKILYEVKPIANIDDVVVMAKEEAARVWANDNGYVFKFISDDWFHENITEDTIDVILKTCIIERDVLMGRLKFCL